MYCLDWSYVWRSWKLRENKYRSNASLAKGIRDVAKKAGRATQGNLFRLSLVNKNKINLLLHSIRVERKGEKEIQFNE